MVIKYDPADGYIKTSLRIANSALPHVLRRREFWLFFAVHLAIYVAHQANVIHYGGRTAPQYMDWKQMKIISGITTFFEVFYTNQSFLRYKQMYSDTRTLLGSMCSFCFIARLHQGRAQTLVRTAARYVVSSSVLFLLEVSGSRSDPEQEELWQMVIVGGGLLKRHEMEYIGRGPRRLQSLALLHWASKLTQEAHKRSKAVARELKPIIDNLVFQYNLQLEIADSLALPMPFQYFHLLNAMVCVNLVLWAYAMGTQSSLWAPVTYFFASTIFLGMMELASQMSDPFGDDDSDFPTLVWLMEVLDDMHVLTEYEFPAFALEPGEERTGDESWTWRAENEQPMWVERAELRKALCYPEPPTGHFHRRKKSPGSKPGSPNRSRSAYEALQKRSGKPRMAFDPAIHAH